MNLSNYYYRCFSLQASNVLVQHISNHGQIEESRSEIFLEYHSSNNFLQRYGGNLYNVYRKNFSLSPIEAAGNTKTKFKQVLNKIGRITFFTLLQKTITKNKNVIQNIYQRISSFKQRT